MGTLDSLFMGIPGTDGIDHSDPIAVLKAISAPPQAAPPTGAGMPQSPIAPPPPSAAPQSDRWRALMNLVAPVAGYFGSPNPAGQAAFMNAWSELEQKHKTDEDQKKQAGAKYLLEVGQHAMGLTDPAQFTSFIKLAEEAGTRAGWIKPGDLQRQIQFPTSQFAANKIQEIGGELDALEKEGYNLDELAKTGSTITLKDRTKIPITTALDLARKRPVDANGSPLAKPSKADTAPPTDFSRYLAKFAKENGKTVDQLTTAEENTARTQYNSDKAAPVSKIAAGGVDAQFNDLVELWKTTHPGQEPPANVRTLLRKQANEVNDRPQSLSGMNSLYNDIDPKAIAAQIRTGDHPPNIEQYGRPAAAAIASELAKKGPNGEPPFKLADAQRVWRAQMNLNRTMNGSQQVRLDESIRSGLAMYDRIDQLADQWDGKGWGVLSRANLAAAREGAKGPQAQSLANQLTGQIGQLTSDVATIEQGGLTPTTEARAVAEKSMQDWWGKGTIKDMTAQGRANMQIRHLARSTQEPMTPGNGIDMRPARPATPANQSDGDATSALSILEQRRKRQGVN